MRACLQIVCYLYIAQGSCNTGVPDLTCLHYIATTHATSTPFMTFNPTTFVTLLSALLGDMIRVKGDANIQGKIAYVPQQAWMQNATLKNNILFGTEYKQELYEKVGLSWILI